VGYERNGGNGYYDILGPRARSLASHPDASVRDFAAETIREIEIFESSEDSYGYAFYLLQRPRAATVSFGAARLPVLESG